MQASFICRGCDKERLQNPRLKGNQQFCGKPSCQRARKTEWQRIKKQTDPAYKTSQAEAHAKWCAQRPLNRYQDEYRKEHPAYVKENRGKQRIRNRKMKSATETIVKMDALNSIEAGTYILRPTPEKIVKMDTFLLTFTLFKEVTAEL